MPDQDEEKLYTQQLVTGVFQGAHNSLPGFIFDLFSRRRREERLQSIKQTCIEPVTSAQKFFHDFYARPVEKIAETTTSVVITALTIFALIRLYKEATKISSEGPTIKDIYKNPLFLEERDKLDYSIKDWRSQQDLSDPEFTQIVTDVEKLFQKSTAVAERISGAQVNKNTSYLRPVRTEWCEQTAKINSMARTLIPKLETAIKTLKEKWHYDPAQMRFLTWACQHTKDLESLSNIAKDAWLRGFA